MSHLPAAKADQWRKTVTQWLNPIHCLSPMRDCNFDSRAGDVIVPHGYRDPIMTNRGALARNRHDIRSSSAILVNVRGATRISGGTFMEVGWAHLLQIPVVCVMEAGNVHEHAMFLEALDYRVNTLTEACDIVRSLLDVSIDPPALPAPELTPKFGSTSGRWSTS